MQLWEMVLLGVGLSMDAFAVSICHGLGMRKINFWHATVVALFFGGSQALMPLLGWLLGSQFQQYIERFDHWIAFALLAVIGGKMLWETLHGGDEDEKPEDSKLDLGRLSFMAVATSIDALAVGVSLALLRVNIALAASTIGVTTFAISFGGVLVGYRFGSRYKQKAEITGGVVLILIGLKILLEGLGILP